MKITRLNKSATIKHQYAKPAQNRRKRYVSESSIESVTKFTDVLNAAGKFTYLDYERNKGAIELFKHQINQAIFNYGIDLQYFRKFNSFFKGEDDVENTANMIYGEDTVASFYASGMIRAAVTVDNMAWSFNQIGFEGTEQVVMYISIDNFEQAFQDQIAKVETREIVVDVNGSTLTNEVTGFISEPEFDANVYARFSDADMKINYSEVKAIDKNVSNLFYKPLKYQSTDNEISGKLSGKVKYDDEKPFIVHGKLKGTLSFHGTKNIEDAETWKRLAPQVGDYFKLNVPTGIYEEWEITQVYDKNLTKSGLNPLLGKYVYQVQACRRVDSYEKNTPELDAKDPGEDLNQIFGNIASNVEEYSDNFNKKKGKNIGNKKTEKLANNIYKYEDKDDLEYGGVRTKPKCT